MAVVTTLAGGTIPGVSSGGSGNNWTFGPSATVEFATGTVFSWISSDGHKTTLTGIFVYGNGTTEPPTSGTVSTAFFDAFNDGSQDMTIDYSASPNPVNAFMFSYPTNFSNGYFNQADTMTLANSGITGDTFAGDGGDENATLNSDTMTITGAGTFVGDSRSFNVDGVITPNDIISVQSSSIVTVSGDVNLIGGTGGIPRTLGFGDDMITGSANFSSIGLTLVGDVLGVRSSGNNNLTFNLGADTITGSAGANIIIGDIDHMTSSLPLSNLVINAGDDVLDGGADGNDTIIGDVRQLSGDTLFTGGDDTIYGRAGNDTIYGDYETVDASVTIVSGGNDIIFGGDGDDIIYGQEGDDIIDGGGVNNGGSDDDRLYGGTNGATGDTVSYASATSSVAVDLTKFNFQETGGGGRDLIQGIENLIGSGFSDVLTGGNDNNTITGGTGDDVINGRRGNDIVDGGIGNDTASFALSAAGVTVTLGGTGNGSATGQGTDTLISIENVIGSDGSDIITGDEFANIIDGGFLNDVMNGMGGIDTISYANAGTANYNFGMGVSIDLGLAGAQVTGGAGTDTISNFENLIGSMFDDMLTGDSGTNILRGGDGADTLDGKNGNNDQLFGEGGDDTLIGQIWSKTYDGGADTDTVDFTNAVTGTLGFYVDLNIVGAQTMRGGTQSTFANIENITGSAGNDFLRGTSDDNILIGNSRADVLFGEFGNDALDGGADNDWLFGGANKDEIFGGTEVDFFAFDVEDDNSGDTISDYASEDFIYLGSTTAPAAISISGGDVIADGVTFTGAASDNVSVVTQDSRMAFDAENRAALQSVLANGVGDLTAFGAFTHTIFDANDDETFTKDISVYTTDGLDYRVVQNDDGSSLQINFDQTNGNGWSEIATTRDTANMITNEVTTLDTGAFFSKFFDVDGTQPWQTSTTGKTATNLTDYQDITYDDNTRIFTDYDQDGTIPWTTALTNYNAAGQQVFRRVNFDDGRFEVTYEDFDSSQDWNTKIDTYTDGVNRDFVNFYNDDGTRKTVDFDQDTSQLWSTKEIFYNAGGAATSFIEYNDDGTRRSKVFDPDDAANWNEILIVYDAAGAQDFRRDDYDLGENGLISYLVREFDNENTEVWDTRFREYDVDDNLLNEYFI